MFLTILLWVASFALSLLLTPKPQDAKKASLEDFEAPTAEDGREIPVLFGTRVITGPNVVWYGDLASKAIKGPRRYGFFGPRQTTGWKYYIGMHMGICHGPVDKVTEIRVGEKVVWAGKSTGGAISINAEKIFGGEKREGGIKGTVDLEMGGPTQGKNSYLVDKLGANVPAFRGVFCAVLRQVYVGNSTYIKPWDFRLQRIFKTSNGAAQWYPAKAGIAGGFRVSWRQKSNGGNDKARVGLEFYNGSTPIGDIIWSSWGAPESWTLRIHTALVPTGATDVRIYMDMKKVAGANNGNYIDDILLSLDGTQLAVTNPSGASGTSGWTTTSGTLVASTEEHYSGTTSFNGGTSGEVIAYQLVSLSSVASKLAEEPHLDMNPAHIIRECLTDRLWGMGYNASDIDDDSFTYAADVLAAEGFGLTLLWLREEEIREFITTVLSHIDAMLYVSRETGKFVLKLIRQDYAMSEIPVFDESDVISWKEVKRRQPSEAVNSVSVNFYDTDKATDGSVSVHNIAQIQQSGGMNTTSRQYQGIGYKELAIRVGMRDLRSLGAGLADGGLVGKRSMADLYPGDPFRLVSERRGFNGEVMRVIETKQGDGRENGITLKFVQDVFGMPDDVLVDDSSSDWEAPISEPAPVAVRLVHEMPWHELVKLVGRTQADKLLTDDPGFGDIQVAGSRPTGDAMDAVISVDSGAGFVDSDEDALQFCPSATLITSLSAAVLDTAVQVDAGIDLADVAAGELAAIGGEIVRIDTIDATTGVVTISRGCLDTVPAAHAVGDKIIFFDSLNGSDQEVHTASDTLHVKLLTLTGSDILDPADAPTDTITLNSRVRRPYPPANLRVDGSVAPKTIGTTASLTWAHRDRLAQTTEVAPSLAASVGPEAGTTYRVDVYGLNSGGAVVGGTPFLTTNVGGATSYTYSQTTNPPPGGTVNFRFKVTSVRGGLDSWQSAAIETNPTSPGDPHFDKVVLLLNFDGEKGATATVDESLSNHPITFVGDAHLDTLYKRFGTASLLLDGTGDWLTSDSHTDWAFGTGQFTVELFVRFDPAPGIDSTSLVGTGNWQLDRYAGHLRFAINGSGVVFVPWTPVSSTWYHVVVDRDASNKVRLYIDGVMVASGTVTNNIPATSYLTIGARTELETMMPLPGRLDMLRITKGVARYGSDAGLPVPVLPYPTF